MGISNASTYLADRLEALRAGQNSDGGWGYYPGKASWLEPTAYAALALFGQPQADRAWSLLRGWQQSTGGWRPSAEVPGANWTTALAILLAARRGGENSSVTRGIEWLRNNRDGDGWAWRRPNPAAIEPTALGLLAMRVAGADADKKTADGLLADRLDPETCGAALVGLQDTAGVGALLELAHRWREETPSALTRAWIGLGLRVNRANFEDPARPVGRNQLVVAIEALGAADGNHGLLRVEAQA